MMILFFKRAIDDILQNRFLNLVTIITISLTILIASAFILFFGNTSDIINSWKRGLRIMAYIKPGTHNVDIAGLERTVQSLDGVHTLRFVSKREAFERLKVQMKHQSSLFESLSENPLPDSFEIRMTASTGSWQKIESLAAQIESLALIEEVEYGQQWIGRFVRIISLFRLAGYAMGALFFMATVFIVANTIRLVIYSRREEVEIMRLVGATDRFIKMPFYIEGLIQGGLGAFIGLVMLFISFFLFLQTSSRAFPRVWFTFNFFLPQLSAGSCWAVCWSDGWDVIFR